MIEGNAKVFFGNGDISILPAFMFSNENNNGVGAILLNNQEPRDIGELVPAGETDVKQTPVVLSFTRIESIDVLIEELQVLKKMMNDCERDKMELIECEDLSFIREEEND